MEGPVLLRDFHVGSVAEVGSRFTRTFGDDYWTTSNIIKITRVEPRKRGLVHVYFHTLNTPYVLEVDARSITYRDDMGPLINETQNGNIESSEWLNLAVEFRKVTDEEFKERQIKDRKDAKAKRQAEADDQ